MIQAKNRPSYQEIIAADLKPAVGVLKEVRNPAQALADVPFSHYTSPEFFEQEMTRMWNHVWQIACREEHLRESGDYFVYEIGRFSILLVRTEAGEIKAYHNSCLHRGTKFKAGEGPGWSAAISCPFHGWTWSLSGELQEVPCSWEFQHLDYAANRLPEVLVACWNGFVFINMDPDAPALHDYLEVLPAHFERWDFKDWYIATHTRKHLDCNWKIAMEAFMEAYHTPVVHPEMCQILGDWNMQHDIFGDHVSRDLCPMGVSSPSLDEPLGEWELLARSRPGDPSTSDTAHLELEPGQTARAAMADETRRRFLADYAIDLSEHSDAEVIDSLKYNVFPNLMFSAGAAMHQLSIFRPLGCQLDKCTIDRMTFLPVPRDGTRPEPAAVFVVEEQDSWGEAPGISEFNAMVLDQDTSIMRYQQEGMHASAKGAQTLSSYQESRIRWLHRTLTKYTERDV